MELDISQRLRELVHYRRNVKASPPQGEYRLKPDPYLERVLESERGEQPVEDEYPFERVIFERKT